MSALPRVAAWAVCELPGNVESQWEPRKGRERVAHDVSRGSRTVLHFVEPRQGRQSQAQAQASGAPTGAPDGFGRLRAPRLTSWATISRPFRGFRRATGAHSRMYLTSDNSWPIVSLSRPTMRPPTWRTSQQKA